MHLERKTEFIIQVSSSIFGGVVVTSASPPAKMTQTAVKSWEEQTVEIWAIMQYLTLSFFELLPFDSMLWLAGERDPRDLLRCFQNIFESDSSGM